MHELLLMAYICIRTPTSPQYSQLCCLHGRSLGVAATGPTLTYLAANIDVQSISFTLKAVLRCSRLPECRTSELAPSKKAIKKMGSIYCKFKFCTTSVSLDPPFRNGLLDCAQALII